MTEYHELDIFGGATPMKRRDKLTIVATRMSATETRAIKSEAERRKCSVAAIVREALQEWLRQNARVGS